MSLTLGGLKGRSKWFVAALVSLGQDQTNLAGGSFLVVEKNIARTVPGAIFENNNFEPKGRLLYQNTIERLLDVFLVIIGCQDYCYFNIHRRILCAWGEPP